MTQDANSHGVLNDPAKCLLLTRQFYQTNFWSKNALSLDYLTLLLPLFFPEANPIFPREGAAMAE